MRPNIAEQVDGTFILIVGISALLLLMITVLMIYFVIKYNRKRNAKASNITGNTTLEVIWTIVPTVIVVVMFFSGYVGFKNMRDVPEDAMVVKVTGRMWVWSYEYANGLKSDTLFVPLSKPIKMEISSLDVNHSFYLPAFRVKEDAIPGRINYLWFQPTELGTYEIACAEYCGLRHSYMYSKLVVMPDDEFYEWYNLTSDSLMNETKPVEQETVSDTLKTQTSTNDSSKK
jgi:cytochrome c oxidase subunit 2